MTAHYLAGLDKNTSDDNIVTTICNNLLNIIPVGPYKLAYEFDAEKDMPPLRCDVILRKNARLRRHTLCAVGRSDKEWSRSWIRQALTLGLHVQRFSNDRGYFTPVAGGSVQEVRNTLDARERMKAFDAKRTLPDYDDSEIPF